MSHALLDSARQLPDNDLLERVSQLAAREQDTIAQLIAHLTDRRVLGAARGKRKREVEEIVATLAPRPDVPTTVRKLPALPLAAPDALSPGAAPAAGKDAPPAPSFAAAEPGVAPILGVALPARVPGTRPPTATTSPLAPDRYRLQVTISGETLEKLRLAADMFGHAIPNDDGAAVIDRALSVLLAELARKKFAATKRPRPFKATADTASRHIPAEVKRAVCSRAEEVHEAAASYGPVTLSAESGVLVWTSALPSYPFQNGRILRGLQRRGPVPAGETGPISGWGRRPEHPASVPRHKALGTARRAGTTRGKRRAGRPDPERLPVLLLAVGPMARTNRTQPA